MNSNKEELVVRAAVREGFAAEIRDGYAYFPEVVWHINIGDLINRDRLDVSWTDTECIVSNDKFKTTAETLEDAVLKHLADRPPVG